MEEHHPMDLYLCLQKTTAHLQLVIAALGLLLRQHENEHGPGKHPT